MEKKHVLVCVTGQKTCERLITEGGRLAKELDAELSVVHVARKGTGLLGGAVAEAEALEYLFKVSTEHGADMTVRKAKDVVDAIEAEARRLNARVLVAGRAANYSGWDLLDELKGRLPDVDFEIVGA